MAKRKVKVRAKAAMMDDLEMDYNPEADYAEGPLSEAQEGQMAGEKIYNEAVDPVNAVLRTGGALRKKISPEAQAQIDADAAALNKSLGRGPSSEDKKKKKKFLIKQAKKNDELLEGY